MRIPAEFRRMALHMHQDIFLIVKSEDELFADLARVPRVQDRSVVVDFIDKLLGSDLSHDELAGIWAEAGADWILQGNSAHGFLQRLRDEIAGGDGE